MKAGDCVQREGEDSVKVVTCDTPEAQYTVLGVVEKQSRYSGQAGACNAYPDTTTVYWEGRNNSTGHGLLPEEALIASRRRPMGR